ncbi:rRNA maturation RNase YbeY [Sessilibacter sp. MAH1]
MSILLDLQNASTSNQLPSEADFVLWSEKALQHADAEWEVTIRLVDEDESQTLNRDYRGKDKPTNVLSFPADIPEELGLNLLGDLVICVPVVIQEAQEQDKLVTAHWAHMVIHGILHLQGFDHIELDEADAMEALEIKILADLGYPDPYVESE